MRPDLPLIPNAADEATTLDAFLDFFRAELVDRCYGLDRAQLDTALPTSSLTLARLIAHLAFVEYYWYRYRFDGADMPEAYERLDFETDPDAEMAAAADLDRDELFAQFDTAVADSRARVAATDSLDQLEARRVDDAEPRNLRWIMVHMIEEYARHCGHADLIREAIDGDTAR